MRFEKLGRRLAVGGAAIAILTAAGTSRALAARRVTLRIR
jgi:hypothetical protein